MPDQCPSQSLHCTMNAQNNSVMLTELEDEEGTQNNQIALTEHAEPAVEKCQAKEATSGKKDRKEKNPLVESEVRRSPRLKKNNKGFKPGTCLSKKCLTCSPTPPDLSLDLIKKLGSNLCQIEDNLLTESSLNQTRKHNSKLLQKENKKPAEDSTKANDIGLQVKKKSTKTASKKKPKETENTDEADLDAQDEDGADPSLAGKKAPKKKSKK